MFGRGDLMAGQTGNSEGGPDVLLTHLPPLQADALHVAILCPCFHHVRKEGYSKINPPYHWNLLCGTITA